MGVVHALGHLPYHRSHFESQDLFETGYFGGLFPDGWINRHLRATDTPTAPPVRGLAIRSSLPRSMDGPYPCFAVASVADLQFTAAQPDVRTTLESIVSTTATSGMSPARQGLYSGMVSSFDLIDHFAGVNPATYVPQNGASYPSTSIGNGLRQIAQVIRADLGVEVFQVDQTGWDHHTGLVASVPIYAGALDAAVSAFVQDLGALMDDVVVLVMTEFGREVRQNGSAGSDHGAGGAMLVIGGSVNGGQVHGAWPGLATSALAEGRFLQPLNDFRRVILEVLVDHMGGTDPQIVFPNFSYVPLGVLGP
jgi:uncharacterized protein (DUF1501 family)